VKAGVVEKSGAWFSYGDERIGQGRENAKQFLKDNPDIALAIEERIRASHGLDLDASRLKRAGTTTTLDGRLILSTGWFNKERQ
jgi:recombination protein RecA